MLEFLMSRPNLVPVIQSKLAMASDLSRTINPRQVANQIAILATLSTMDLTRMILTQTESAISLTTLVMVLHEVTQVSQTTMEAIL